MPGRTSRLLGGHSSLFPSSDSDHSRSGIVFDSELRLTWNCSDCLTPHAKILEVEEQRLPPDSRKRRRSPQKTERTPFDISSMVPPVFLFDCGRTEESGLSADRREKSSVKLSLEFRAAVVAMAKLANEVGPDRVRWCSGWTTSEPNHPLRARSCPACIGLIDRSGNRQSRLGIEGLMRPSFWGPLQWCPPLLLHNFTVAIRRTWVP